ncbi:Acetyl-CoA hydrolase/transferase N-terminal domain-containing protein [Desulfatibacillum alkenivorans DSM 16219]|uniref:Acetyl-CoA hydrolase/transferase N-terminal domain-containing protein n=1 Tax=Desulfatibacillum alkenivorans DSM 16219 TaxID=1121393 RepID=A0A1M6UN27_9BACT|nr:acetyl-CoA hydrolase/transferase C-terminal domain-containing protein [Desulfatibacillum alkenivorans]SHK70581.1 Acetyl-CoA hydrolase/transferase N-terminal domain-containing protein [Desulfatibacillum alkenivorans DSM 16219]
MKHIANAEEAVNNATIPKGSRIYCAGNASTPQVLLKRLASDASIQDVELLGVLLLGDIEALFSPETCARITHRVIFNSAYSRPAVNNDTAMYQLMHLSDIPRQIRSHLQPDVALISVSGPDNGGNYSLGSGVEAVPAAIETVKARGGVIIAERNARMPFILGATIREESIDYLLDTDYELPVNPSHQPDDRAKKIARLIAQLYIHDGCTLQYGIGEVPEAVTDAVIEKGVKDLGIHTELFATAMRKLVDAGIATNKYTQRDFCISTLFLADDHDGYQWLHYNSSVQSRPCDVTNSVINIAAEPNMVAVNSAIGVDLHGNIWADSLSANKIYSGIGGQADFLRGAYMSHGGTPIIAIKSTTGKGASKVLEKCPEGVSSTAIAADPVVIVSEYGAFDPRGLSIGEHAVGIAYLAEPAERERLLQHIYDHEGFHKPRQALKEKSPKGFTAYEEL